MWRFCFAAASLALVLSAARSASAQSTTSLLVRDGGVPCQIVMGRIMLCEQRSLQIRSETVEEEKQQRRETLCVQTGNATVVVRYESTSPTEQFTLDLLGHGELHIKRQPRGESALPGVTFAQPLKGALRLEVVAGQSRQEYTASSLWHLLLIEPQVCREYLIPLLERLQPQWQLDARREAVERALAEATTKQADISPERIAQLLTELSSDTFRARQAADRELRSLGMAILPALVRMSASECDAEQRSRVSALKASLLASTPDNPQRVASWLVADETLWRALAKSQSPLKETALSQTKSPKP